MTLVLCLIHYTSLRHPRRIAEVMNPLRSECAESSISPAISAALWIAARTGWSVRNEIPAPGPPFGRAGKPAPSEMAAASNHRLISRVGEQPGSSVAKSP